MCKLAEEIHYEKKKKRREKYFGITGLDYGDVTHGSLIIVSSSALPMELSPEIYSLIFFFLLFSLVDL